MYYMHCYANTYSVIFYIEFFIWVTFGIDKYKWWYKNAVTFTFTPTLLPIPRENVCKNPRGGGGGDFGSFYPDVCIDGLKKDPFL